MNFFIYLESVQKANPFVVLLDTKIYFFLDFRPLFCRVVLPNSIESVILTEKTDIKDRRIKLKIIEKIVKIRLTSKPRRIVFSIKLTPCMFSSAASLRSSSGISWKLYNVLSTHVINMAVMIVKTALTWPPKIYPRIRNI